MKPLRLMRSLILLSALATIISVTACNKEKAPKPEPVVPPDVRFSARLVKTLDAADLEKRLKAELRRRYERMYFWFLSWDGGFGASKDDGVAITSEDSLQPSTSGTSDTAHSETNVQEKGVDEGDLVKTDGSFIYLARGTHFFILKANPAADTALVKDIDLKEPINELHLSGSLISIITTTYIQSNVTPASTTSSSNEQLPGANSSPPLMSRAMSIYGISYNPITRIYHYDVSTAAAPTLTASFDFPGYLRGSRRIGGTIYLVTNHTIDIPDPANCFDYLDVNTPNLDHADFNSACEKAISENIRKIEGLTIDQLMPTRTTTLYTGGVSGTPSTAPAVGYADVYIPEFGNGTDLAIVFSIDLSGQTPAVASSAVLSSWGGLYMSLENLYLTSDNYWLWIEPEQNADMSWKNPEPRTAVHKFSVPGTGGKPLYRGSGMVDGWLNDRFSLGEYNGYLRIGTTRGGWWGEGRSNQLAVLAESDGSLVTRGTITGLAPGERIYSMRYDRDRGYMVTYRQTDPLFTLDLSDPANPRVAGELKVNGFATYIHLVGADRLLTIGRSADATGRVTGNKLQLFNVSDLAAPTLLADFELGQGWSDAIYDPHAFLYYEPFRILTIPYTDYGTYANGYKYSSGLKVFNIDTTGISPRAGGIITSPTITSSYGYPYQDTIDRAVIIENNIFALAQNSVTVAGTEQLDILKSVILPESYWYGPYVYGDTGGIVSVASPPPPATGPGTSSGSSVMKPPEVVVTSSAAGATTKPQ